MTANLMTSTRFRAAVALAASLTLVACGKPPPAISEQAAARAERVVQVATRSLTGGLDASGLLVAREAAAVLTEQLFSGYRVARVLVEPDARVAAGQPMLAEEHIEGRFQIDPALFQPRAHYLLKVVGMSMKNAGILDGDLVAVHRTPEVRNRQIVVARLENEVTVKRYRQEGSIVWLLPENADFEPIRVDLKEQPMIIEGVVVGVLRRGKDVDAA